MKDRFDVQLGVARPVDPGAVPRTDPAPDPKPEPVVVVEYRHRGVPIYMMPPLLILLAALGIMSYQNVSASLPLRPVAQSGSAAETTAAKAVNAGAGEDGVDAKVEPAHVVVVQKPDERPPVLVRPPIPEPKKPEIEVVETSAAKPATTPVAVASRPAYGPEALFEHETADGLRPIAPEPPLVAPRAKP